MFGCIVTGVGGAAAPVLKVGVACEVGMFAAVALGASPVGLFMASTLLFSF